MVTGINLGRRAYRFRKTSFVAICVLTLFAGALFRANGAGSFTCQTWNQATLKTATPGDGWTLGTKRLLYYRVRFTDTTETEPISVNDADQILFLANKTFERMSFGQFSLTWTISSLIQLDHEIAYYSNADFNTLLFDVRNAAAESGLHYEDFDLD